MSLHATHHGAPLVGSPLEGTTIGTDEEMPDGLPGTNKVGPSIQQREAGGNTTTGGDGQSKTIADYQVAEMQPHGTSISTAEERFALHSKAALTFTDSLSAEMQLPNELMQQTKIPISLCGDSGPLPPQQGNPGLQKHFGPSSVSVTHTHRSHEIHINPIAITPTQMNVDGESGFQGNRNVASTSGDN